MPHSPEGTLESYVTQEAQIAALEAALTRALADLREEREEHSVQRQLAVLSHQVKELRELADQAKQYAAASLQLINETRQIATALLQMHDHPLVLPKTGPVT